LSENACGAAPLGLADGLTLGDFEGLKLGDFDGDSDGLKLADGERLGDLEGLRLAEGDKLGEPLGLIEGDALGDLDGDMEGLTEGDKLGLLDGEAEGLKEGLPLGDRDGETDGEREAEGEETLAGAPVPFFLYSSRYWAFVGPPVEFITILSLVLTLRYLVMFVSWSASQVAASSSPSSSRQRNPSCSSAIA
jgi:hypothetical protein